MKKSTETVYWYIEPMNEGQELNYSEVRKSQIMAEARAYELLKGLKALLTEGQISVRVYNSTETYDRTFEMYHGSIEWNDSLKTATP